jgi:cyclopropane fatty-acyl-phospholipid synthase-like methyltransferase
MVYVSSIDDRHTLIFEGPVLYDGTTEQTLASSNMDDVRNYWEFQFVPEKEAEWPALRENAFDALQRMEKFLPSGTDRRILDFGSGWGFFLAAARERGWETFGLEPLPACAVYSRSKFNLNIIVDTLREDTFPKDHFDCVTSFQVFEHLPYPATDVRHFHRMLKKGGLLLIEVPSFDTWTMKILGARHRHFVQDHLNFFPLRPWAGCYQTAGIKPLASIIRPGGSAFDI